MKKLIALFFFAITVFSCKNSDEEIWIDEAEPAKLTSDFGFDYSHYNVVQDTVNSGDTFSSILQKQNLAGKPVFDILQKVKDSLDTRIIKTKKPYTILRSKDKYNKLEFFVYQPDRLHYYILDLRDSVVVHKKTRPLKFKNRTIAAVLNGSLSETLQREKIDPTLATKIAKIYAWSIDFFKLKRGDKFAISFTERYINDTIYDGVDSLRCAFFEYKGKKIYAFPFSQDNRSRHIDYFDEEGRALKNFFLKAPLKFVNITSRFSRNRFHPVQMRWKAHNGTDYAAPTGTPIMTTASGIVEKAGYTAGNGNFVKVKHDKTYSTQYLHMSRILVKRGQRVAQGQVIGRVGSTGLATGPHVCYRFWKNGVQVDALKLKLPNSTPMDSKNRPRYMKYITPLKRELDSIAKIKFKE